MGEEDEGISKEEESIMILDDLVQSGDIASYRLETLDDSGNVIAIAGKGMRETERVVLTLPSGKELIIDTFCSGCMENTSLQFSGKAGTWLKFGRLP